MLTTVVLKVAAPCNLNCSYCYEYQSGDGSWRAMPKHVPPSTAESLGRKICAYAVKRGIGRFDVMLHGGEPLLLGRTRLQEIIDTLRSAASPIELRIGMQTNAVLMTRELAEFLKQNDIKVGVSLDGNVQHNRRRVDLKGLPTFERALGGYRIMQEHAPENLAGILTVIDLDNDPKETISFLCSLEPRQLDLLLPFETHETLGDGARDWSMRMNEWLREAFNVWFSSQQFGATKIRIFEDAMQAVVTRRPRTDWFGPRRVSYLVVATNGDVDVLDHLKVIGEHSEIFRGTSANINVNELEEAEAAALAVLERSGANRAPSLCSQCELLDVCSGGYLPHRYSIAKNFDNPSVACEAIIGLFRRVAPIINLSEKHVHLSGKVVAE